MTDLDDQEREALVTDTMVDAAFAVIRRDGEVPYMARVSDFTDEEVAGGELKRADDLAEERNREWVCKVLEAALAAREEPRFDQVTIGREEFEQIRRAQGFALFVAALDKPVAVTTRRKMTLERLIEKANDALSGVVGEDTERPDGEHWTLWICNECGWTTATYPPYALCCSVEPHKNQSMTSVRVVRDIEQEQDQ